MLKSLILFSLVAFALAEVDFEDELPQLDGRIIGGEATNIEKHPWQVSLQMKNSHFCGGSLYSKNIVITAAHCLQNVNPASVKVRVGSTTYNRGGQLVNVAAIKVHEGYSSQKMVNDIAVMRLAQDVTFNKSVRTVQLADKAPPSSASAVVTGWGVTNPNGGALPQTLQAVTVKMVSTKECASNAYGYGNAIKPSMICGYARGKDSCQGDSGGPLVSGNRLVGVVSWGQGCAYSNYPGVYADVAYLKPWILKTVNKLSA